MKSSMLLAAMGLFMGTGHSHRVSSTIPEERYENLKPRLKIPASDVPKGCTLENIAVQVQLANHIATVKVDIFYQNRNGRAKKINKVGHDVANWVSRLETAHALAHPDVTMVAIQRPPQKSSLSPFLNPTEAQTHEE